MSNVYHKDLTGTDIHETPEQPKTWRVVFKQ